MKQDGTPSNLRALFAYGLGLQVDGELTIRSIVVLDKNEDEVSQEVANKYIEELKLLKTGAIEPNAAKMRLEGYKHIADLGVIEGNYLVANLAVDGDYNKVTGLSKVPMSFSKETAETENAESITKFNDVIYPKIVENRKQKASGTQTGASTISSSYNVVEESSIDLSDMPF